MRSRSLLYSLVALACLAVMAIATSQLDSTYVDPAVTELSNQVIKEKTTTTTSYKGEPWATSSLNDSNQKAASVQAIAAAENAAVQTQSSDYMSKADSFLKEAANNDYYVLSAAGFINKTSTDSNWVIVDVRPGQLYSAGHIAGAINIPLDNLISQMGQIPADRKVAVYCAIDTNAAFAVQTLRVYGDREAFVLSGGVLAWQAAGMPLVT
jgi:rhodanese-related sulfurtransferase